MAPSIDLLKFEHHDIASDWLNTNFSHDIIPTITKPTHIKLYYKLYGKSYS